MKKILFLVLMGLFGIFNIALGSTKYISQELSTGAGTTYEPYDTWQTFTPLFDFKITSVFLLAYKPAGQDLGLMTLSIQGVDASHHPTGAVLCSGTYDQDLLGTDSAGTRFEVTLGAGADLLTGVQYGFYIEAPDSTPSAWRKDRFQNTNVYSGGFWGYTTGDHSGWGDYTTYDVYFEIWGEIAGGTTVSPYAQPLAVCLLGIFLFSLFNLTKSVSVKI